MERVVACSLAVVMLMLMAPLAGAQSQGMGGMEMKGMDQKGMQGMDMRKDTNSDKKGKSQAHQASGTVTKVDSEKNAVTVAHGPVQSMNWPAMTMTFKVKDKAMLDNVKQGEKVEFSFVQSGKDYVITSVK